MKILLLFLKLNEETIEKIVFVGGSIAIGLFANIVAAFILKYMLKW